MQHAPVTDVALRLVRTIACPNCAERPPFSEGFGSEAARACEGRCALVARLPTLVRLAGLAGDARGGCARPARGRDCGGCRLNRTAADATAAAGDTRVCPVSRFGGEVVAALRRAAGLVPNETFIPLSLPG